MFDKSIILSKKKTRYDNFSISFSHCPSTTIRKVNKTKMKKKKSFLSLISLKIDFNYAINNIVFMHFSCDFLLFLEHDMKHKKLLFIMDGVLCHFPAATILPTTCEGKKGSGGDVQPTNQPVSSPFPFQKLLHSPQ
jgi:hypothetical protein